MPPKVYFQNAIKVINFKYYVRRNIIYDLLNSDRSFMSEIYFIERINMIFQIIMLLANQ